MWRSQCESSGSAVAVGCFIGFSLRFIIDLKTCYHRFESNATNQWNTHTHDQQICISTIYFGQHRGEMCAVQATIYCRPLIRFWRWSKISRKTDFVDKITDFIRSFSSFCLFFLIHNSACLDFFVFFYHSFSLASRNHLFGGLVRCTALCHANVNSATKCLPIDHWWMILIIRSAFCLNSAFNVYSYALHPKKAVCFTVSHKRNEQS